MDLDNETQEKIRELQSHEQNLQTLLMQKQAFTYELSELENALEEMKKSSGEVFKIVGSIMIKSKKDDLEKELKQKSDLINIRLKSLQKQEAELSKVTEELRSDVMKKIK